MECSVKERLRSFLKINNIKAVDFCNAIGVSSGFISGMRESVQPDKLKSIAINYPSLNIAWLMTGIGSMLNNESAKVADSMGDVVRLENEIKFLKEELKESYKEIGRLEGENQVLREQLRLGDRKNERSA